MDIVLNVIAQAVRYYVYVMIIYILLSWTPLRTSQFYRALARLCDPYLNIFRGKLVFSNMDFGGIIGIILLQLLSSYLLSMV